jgi:Transglycosylase SLT domain
MHTRVLTVVLALLTPAATAYATDKAIAPASYACTPGLTAAERDFALPAKLLNTIAIVESGRPDPISGRVTPWPWTINVGGTGRFFETKEAAIEAVRDLQAAGIRSIDVGCMQINLMHHPDAFASLDEAFDPRSNTRYGARFLSALYREIGNWPQAAAAYHSRTHDLGADYETRVMAIWPLADRFPDAALRLNGRGTAPVENFSNYTPQFAAQVRQMHADLARLSAMSAPLGQPRNRFSRTAQPGGRGYTSELASEMRQAARSPVGRTAFVSQPGSRTGVRVASQIGR